MNADFTQYNDLISQIEAMPQMSPPVDVTQRMMEKIGQKEKEPFFAFRRRFYLTMQGAFARPQTKEDCAISFISLSFFYLIAALILLFSIKDISGASGVYKWLKLQPSLFIMVSLWLAFVGSVIWAKGKKAAQFAHVGSYIYIFIFVIGGIIVSLGGKIEMLFALMLSLGALFTGISLDAAVNRLVHEEGN